jgi:hypothetical protein
MTDFRIPDGYRKDAQGRLVPETIIPAADTLRDELVIALCEATETASQMMASLKRMMLDKIAEHIALVATQYDVTLGGEGGNVTLVSYDGLYKIERECGERLTLGEEIIAAEALVREVLDEIGDPIPRAITDRAFRRNRRTGDLSPSRIADQILAIQIDDERWKRAQDAVRDALSVSGTAVYFRAYRRDSADAPWKQIVLDFSRIEPMAEDNQLANQSAPARQDAA